MYARTPRRRAQDKTMVHYTNYTPAELARCMDDLLTMWGKATSNSLQAVQEKYGNARFQSVARIKPPDSIPPIE